MKARRNTLLTLLIFIISLLAFPVYVQAQKVKKVHGKASISFSLLDSQMSGPEAKRECIKQAQLNAIKEAFGELITSNTNVVDANVCGQEVSNFYEEVNLSSKAEWIEDTKTPSIKTESNNGIITITAEVWGKAREVPTASIDIDWKIMTGRQGHLFEADRFSHKQPIYIRFKAPVDGYLAIYLLDSTQKEANCLLPYKNNPKGRHEVKGGVEYTLFDKESDPKAFHYNLTTPAPVEVDNVVLIFSPNAFTKCNEITGDRRHPNSLSMDDFNAWLRKLQLRDTEMVVDKSKIVTIINEKSNK